jgi:hypothetical protein
VDSLPLQNRVDPWGRLDAVEPRQTLMGNRGCLHDDEGRIVRHHVASNKRWILCLLQFNGRHRELMAPGRYTELFFLDEATGLAAGHRPCFECQRSRYRAFVDAWTRGNPGLTLSPRPSADEIDAILHRERIDGRDGKRVHPADFAELPAGAMILSDDDHSFLVRRDVLLPWGYSGYGAPLQKPARGAVRLLTPPSIVNALRAGFEAGVHPSAVAQ